MTPDCEELGADGDMGLPTASARPPPIQIPTPTPTPATRRVGRRPVIEDVDIDQFIQEIASHRENFSLKLSASCGLGVNWIIFNGQVFVQSFSPVILFENQTVEESGYVMGPIESGGLVKPGDRLLRVGNLALDSLDLMQLKSTINAINVFAEVGVFYDWIEV
jgi:hypothetical protein